MWPKRIPIVEFLSTKLTISIADLDLWVKLMVGTREESAWFGPMIFTLGWLLR